MESFMIALLEILMCRSADGSRFSLLRKSFDYGISHTSPLHRLTIGATRRVGEGDIGTGILE